jgi:hypothetical protein
MSSFLPCLHHLDIHRHSEVSRVLKNQEQALQSALSVMARSQITAIGVESIAGIAALAEELNKLRSDRFDHSLDLYRQYSNHFREEVAKCQSLNHSFWFRMMSWMEWLVQRFQISFMQFELSINILS